MSLNIMSQRENGFRGFEAGRVQLPFSLRRAGFNDRVGSHVLMTILHSFYRLVAIV